MGAKSSKAKKWLVDLLPMPGGHTDHFMDMQSYTTYIQGQYFQIYPSFGIPEKCPTPSGRMLKIAQRAAILKDHLETWGVALWYREEIQQLLFELRQEFYDMPMTPQMYYWWFMLNEMAKHVYNTTVYPGSPPGYVTLI
jgi:hypothetical protein